MKNIIMSLLVGVALICSAEACHMNQRPMHSTHTGVHKMMKKHGAHRHHHKRNLAPRGGMKVNESKMFANRHGMKANKHKMFAFFGGKQVQKRHQVFGKRAMMKSHRKYFIKRDRQFTAKAKSHPRYKITFGPTKRYNTMNELPKHLRPAPAMMQKPLIIRKKNHRG